MISFTGRLSAVLVSVGLITGCSGGVRDIDLESKQFEVTYNVDSTRGMDSTRLKTLQGSKAIYSFSKGGKGTQHTQTGMLSKDSSFTWQAKGDSLMINRDTYAIQKQDNGYKLKSASAMMILSQQP